ncbi:hypothetical protein BDN72DRAFT_830569 [Pluteus cervinus]|uniref:Uncharacterized protein n=1 Tax=Pluteus cervinus TaxID=181527 RepID=A0ACD3BH12_9AGAR|nr:hypothetical protein BDN72DRAFT_830569 [Pluteus cervinus]
MLRFSIARPLCSLGRPSARFFSVVNTGEDVVQLRTGAKEVSRPVDAQKRDGNSDIRYLRTGGLSLAERLAQKLQGPLPPAEQSSPDSSRPPTRKPKTAPNPVHNSQGAQRGSHPPQNSRAPTPGGSFETRKPKQRKNQNKQRTGQRAATRQSDLPLPFVPSAVPYGGMETAIANDPNREGDITFDIIEAGGEHSEPPMFTTPEQPSTDLQEIFGRIPPGLQPVGHRLKGDYSLYTRPAADFALASEKLNPITQATLAMAHQKGVHLTQRSLVSQIIQSAVKTSSSSQ